MQTAPITGYAVSSGGLEGDVHDALQLIRSGRYGHYVACLNPHSVVVASRDDEFRKALNNADLLLPDGAGIVLAARILGQPIRERVAGFEFFMALTRQIERHGGGKFCFLGSSTDVLARIERRMQREFPCVDVVATISPPFRDSFSNEENEEMIDRINQARPDVLWVGMTAPKQEKWIHMNRHRLNVPLIGAIGAVFDFYAGTKKRAPAWAQKLGLEWLPRLLREPRRLFVRNFVSSPRFLWMVLQEWYSGGSRA